MVERWVAQVEVVPVEPMIAATSAELMNTPIFFFLFNEGKENRGNRICDFSAVNACLEKENVIKE